MSPMPDTTPLPLFERLSAAGRRLAAAALIESPCEPGGPIIHKGQRVSGAYFVVCGRLRVYTLSPGGQEATLYHMDPGETCVLALNCLFNDLLYPAWVQAERPTRIALLPGPVYRQLFRDEPAIQDATVRALSTAVFRLMATLEEVHACKLEQRLANLLLLRADSNGALAMTQEQMARHLGTTREVVARLLRQYVAAGAVATARGRISITCAPALARFAQPD